MSPAESSTGLRWARIVSWVVGVGLVIAAGVGITAASHREVRTSGAGDDDPSADTAPGPASRSSVAPAAGSVAAPSESPDAPTHAELVLEHLRTLKPDTPFTPFTAVGHDTVHGLDGAEVRQALFRSDGGELAAVYTETAAQAPPLDALAPPGAHYDTRSTADGFDLIYIRSGTSFSQAIAISPEGTIWNAITTPGPHDAAEGRHPSAHNGILSRSGIERLVLGLARDPRP